MMIQRFVVVLLVMVVVFVGCGEDEPEKVKPKKDEASKEIIWKKDGAKMVLIPAGSFEMGDHSNEGPSDERSVHTVELDAFYMDVHKVTVGQFKQFVEDSSLKGGMK